MTDKQKKAVKILNKLRDNNELMKLSEEDPDLYSVTRKAVEKALKNLWHDAQGDVLPEIDREVIVLYLKYPLEESEYTIGFAHRPNLDGGDGKSVTTEEIEHYIPKIYGKGGWNIPDVKWWLDLEIPKERDL